MKGRQKKESTVLCFQFQSTPFGSGGNSTTNIFTNLTGDGAGRGGGGGGGGGGGNATRKVEVSVEVRTENKKVHNTFNIFKCLFQESSPREFVEKVKRVQQVSSENCRNIVHICC